MTRNPYRTFAVVMTLIALAWVAVFGTQDASHGSGKAWNRPVRCVMHVNGDGNASIGHCHTTHPVLAWQRHVCPNDDATNCFNNTGGDGGSHNSYRHTIGSLFCVNFVGTPRYQRRHDYCIDNSRTHLEHAATRATLRKVRVGWTRAQVQHLFQLPGHVHSFTRDDQGRRFLNKFYRTNRPGVLAEVDYVAKPQAANPRQGPFFVIRTRLYTP